MSYFNRRKFLLSSLSGLSLVPMAGMMNFASAKRQLASSHWRPYQDTIVVDGLGGAFELDTKNIDSAKLAIIKNSGITAINMTLPYPGDDYQTTLKKVESTKNIIQTNPEHFLLVDSAADIQTAKRENKLGIIMGFQSTEMFDESLSGIEFFAKSGVKIMQLSYNGRSPFGSGGLIKNDQGITTLGAKAIDLMEQHQVIVDLSHSGKNTVASAIKKAKRPLVISHTGCNAIYRHPRNNDDAELSAVAANGGLVGIYLMPFLEGGSHEIKAEMVIKHILHALNVCGEDHVAIGSDQNIIPVHDTPEYRQMIREEVERRIAAGISAPGETPNRPPFIAELNSERRMELIAFRLQQKGVSERVIAKILGQNWFRMFTQIWGEK